MKRDERKLTDLFREFAERQAKAGRPPSETFQNRRCVSRLAVMEVTTNDHLIAALPTLPPKLKEFALWWFQVTRPRRAEVALLRMLHDEPRYREWCAHTLGMIGGRRSIREFVRIARTQLASKSPDRRWLAAVIGGIKLHRTTAEVSELLLTIYERTDLPGWLRGDAGDALGCCGQRQDRRTSFFRRSWATARKGIDDSDIEMTFWSMYVIMQLACNSTDRVRSNAIFSSALPRLREIAANDHRLAPGFWWPMSAEAEDAIFVIDKGCWPEKDAGERWLGNQERGPMIRDT